MKVHKIVCPYCESQAFRYPNGTKEMFLCHDCQRNVTWSFVSAHNKVEEKEASRVRVNYESLLRFATPVKDLPKDHFCVKYLQSRKLDNLDYVQNNFYFTDRMSLFSQATDIELTDGQPKLIIPFFDENAKLFGLQARALDNSIPKYITLMFDKSYKKIFGLDRIDVSKPIVCVEGPIDSLFVKNSIAMAGSDGLDDKYKTNTVIAFDNEPRSKQTVLKMEKYLNKGYNIVIWPDKIKEKDVNDMILRNIDVEAIIHNNVYSGLTGKIKLNSWKRV